VVVFGLPGAFTSTCSTAHVPSYMRVMASLTARGVDEVVCIAGNDPWVMKAWGESTGAASAGITMLADPTGDWIEALGTAFDAPRWASSAARAASRPSCRTAVDLWHEEAGPGVCEATAGEAMLAAIG
jgi:cytochrome c peroxidase